MSATQGFKRPRDDDEDDDSTMDTPIPKAKRYRKSAMADLTSSSSSSSEWDDDSTDLLPSGLKAKGPPMPSSYGMPIPSHVPILDALSSSSAKTTKETKTPSPSTSPSACLAPHDVVQALCTCVQHPHQRAMEIESTVVQEYKMRAETERRQAALLRAEVSGLRKKLAEINAKAEKEKKRLALEQHNAELERELKQDDFEEAMDNLEHEDSIKKAEIAALRKKNREFKESLEQVLERDLRASDDEEGDDTIDIDELTLVTENSEMRSKIKSLKKSLIQALNDSSENQQRAEYAEQQLRELRGQPKAPRRKSRFDHPRLHRVLPKAGNGFGLHFTRSPKEQVNAKISVGDFVILRPPPRYSRHQDVFWIASVLYISPQKGSLTVDYYVYDHAKKMYVRSLEAGEHGVSVVRTAVLAFSERIPWVSKDGDVDKLTKLITKECNL